MRENGLHAAAYVAIADLHPMLADLLLEALADEGVAAYAAPAPSGHRGPAMDRVLPHGPADRLWVDRLEMVRARALLRQRLPVLRAELERTSTEATGGSSGRPEHGPSDVLVDDATWEGIVASFQTTDPRQPRSWPSAEDVDPDDTDAGNRAGDPDTPTVTLITEGAQSAAEGWADLPDAGQPGRPGRSSAPRDPVDHFVPPPPPPLPEADRTTRIAWACVIGGPVLFLIALLLGWQLSSWAQLAGVAALVGGFVTLVTRMRDRDDEPDDGAIV